MHILIKIILNNKQSRTLIFIKDKLILTNKNFSAKLLKKENSVDTSNFFVSLRDNRTRNPKK